MVNTWRRGVPAGLGRCDALTIYLTVQGFCKFPTPKKIMSQLSASHISCQEGGDYHYHLRGLAMKTLHTVIASEAKQSILHHIGACIVTRALTDRYDRHITLLRSARCECPTISIKSSVTSVKLRTSCLSSCRHCE